METIIRMQIYVIIGTFEGVNAQIKLNDCFLYDNLKAVSQVEKEKRYIAEEINLSGNPEVLRVRTAGCIVQK